jgi:hypothetical protein
LALAELAMSPGHLHQEVYAMQIIRIIAAIFVCSFALFTGASASRADDCEDTIARHMVGEALLAAHFVALAEKQGMTTGEIDAILKSIAEKSAIQEFWITDSAGHAYLTNTGIDFTFSPDTTKQPPGVRILAADQRQQGHCDPGRAQA